MAIPESGRMAIAGVIAAMGLATVIAAGGVDGISSISDPAEAATTTTLVPRPTPSSTQDGAGPTEPSPSVTLSTVESLLPSVTTTTSDPFAWLSTIPVQGQIFLGVSTAGGTTEEAAAFGEAAGKAPDAVMVSRSWADGASPDTAIIEAITAAGYFPVIAWEPWDYQVESTFDTRRGEQPDFDLGSIIAGDHDDLITDWATAMAQWGRPVAIRFAHEMNGWWYPWSESSNGNHAGQYVGAWRHVHDIFTANDAGNVIWIWSPNPVQPTLTPLSGLYPGDDYVDWLGLIGYLGNGIDPRVYVPSFEQLFGPTISELRELSDLPMVITEIGATELGDRKADWIHHIFGEIAERDDVIGVMWFEVDKETDWRIVSSEAARVAFAAAISSDRFGTPRS